MYTHAYAYMIHLASKRIAARATTHAILARREGFLPILAIFYPPLK